MRAWWQRRDFVDRLGVVVTATTCALLITLILATVLNTDHP